MAAASRHVVIVVGMHRSGTSAVTRGLSALGVELGDNLAPPGDCNETGYWEDRDVVSIDIDILTSLGATWNSVGPVAPEKVAALSTSPLAPRAADLLRRRLGRGGIFGMKDPRIARLIPFWRAVLDQLGVRASWVIACRNPLNVVRSLAARDGFDPPKSFVLWLEHMLSALVETAGQNRVVVDYDRLMDAPAVELGRIARALRIPFDPANPEVATYSEAFLQQRLRHTRFSLADLAGDPLAPPVVSELYTVLQDLAAAAGGPPDVAGCLVRAADWLRQSRPILLGLDQRDEIIRSASADSAASAGRIATLDTASAEKDGRIAALGAALGERDAQIAALDAALAGRDVRIAFLDAEVRHQTERGHALKEKAEAGDAKTAALRAEVAAQAEMLAGGLSKQAEQACRIQALQADVDHQAEQLRRFDSAIAERDRRIEDARNGIASRDNRIGALETNLTQCGEEILRLRAAVADREDLLADIYRSAVWRISRFLRGGGSRLASKTPSPAVALKVPERSAQAVPGGNGHAELVFHTADMPDVSVIIPAYKHFDQTMACLASISLHSGTAYTYEVILADDGVDDPIVPRLPKVPGLCAYVNERNLGFLRNCAAGAGRAKGRHLLFLNNDTLVGPDWLAPLVRLADADATVGMVGCCLLNADGSIQDAGWTILADGWGYPIGRGDSPDLGEYGHVREVDCVGGACFLVTRAAYESAGGFDDSFAPAFYEEFDLAFAMRERGFRVVVQPESRVRHLGSASYGAETRDRLSAVNHGRFTAKWSARLAGRPVGTEPAFCLRERFGDRPAILVIDDRIPEYDHHAGGLTIDQYLHLLLRMGWRVIFAPADGLARPPYARRLQQDGLEIVVAPDTVEGWLERHGRNLAVIWSARPQVTEPLLPLFRAASGARVVYYTHDLHYLREQRRYEIERDPAILVAAAAVRAQEMAIFQAVDRILSPSAEEAQRIREDIPGADATVIPPYLYPPSSIAPPTAERFAGLREIVFVGGFPHRPNVDAALWLAGEIMPLVWEQEPDVHLLLVGYAPPPEVQNLAGPRVSVTGEVPDLDPYFRRAKFSVCPLRYGAGVKGKIVTAMASAVPVVTSSVGAEGIGLVDGVSALVADDAPGLAERIVRLLRSDALCAALAEAGRRIVDENFSESAAERRLAQVLDFSGDADAPTSEKQQDAIPGIIDGLAKRFCFQPWRNVEVYDGGVYVCCPAWNHNQAIGDIHTDSLDNIWNGEPAQRFRQGILDGSFAECDREKCNLIVNRSLPYRDDLGTKWSNEDRRIVAEGPIRLDRGPRMIKLGYDSSCNLSCPSCRTGVLSATKSDQSRLDALFEDKILPLLRDAEMLLLSSDGDPIASAHYRHVLKATAERLPALKIGLSTNGLLLDQRAWNDLRLEGRVHQVQVSADAARADTYAIVRRPGKFDRLMANLTFLAAQRRAERFGSFEISFVVQAANYREMADFVRLGRDLNADAVVFMLIDQWQRGMDGDAYRAAKIWDPAHPQFADFRRSLSDPVFDDPIVRLNGLQAIRDGWAPPELQVTTKGGIVRGNASVLPAKKSLFSDFIAAFPHARTSTDNLVKPDLVLVQAPGWGVNTPPLGTAMLSAQARRHGYKVLPLDLNLEFYAARPPEYSTCWDMEQSLWFWETPDGVKDLLRAMAPKVDAFVDVVLGTGAPAVGFTVYGSSLIVTLELARRLKERRPELVIVLGGPHVSRDMAGRSVILDHNIDAVAQGEGDETLLDVLGRVKAGQPLDGCPGLLLRRDGAVLDTGDRPAIRNLDEIPVPDFSDFSFQAYRTPTRLPLMGSRGCPNGCIFCNERQYWGRFRFRSADAIVDEIEEQIRRYPFIDFVEFQDSLVNGRIDQLERMAELLIQRNIGVHWSGQAVVRKEMTYELLVELKKSGCVCLAYGLETPSPSLMRSVGKHLSKAADIDALAEAHGRSGLGAVYNVMFGLPGETEEDSFAILEFLRRNRKFGLVVNPSPSFCSFGRGTPGYESPEKFGIDVAKGSLYWQSVDGRNTYLTRLKRFEDFCRLVAELGIETTYPATHLLDRDRSLGRYFELSGDLPQARRHYQAWLKAHPEDRQILSSLERLNTALGEEQARPIVYPLLPSTDGNWRNGVAIGWATAFIVADTADAEAELLPGRTVVFADGSERRITDSRSGTQSRIVFLEGVPLDGDRVGYPAGVRVLP